MKKGMSRLLAALLLMFLAACGKTATSGGEDEVKIGAIFSASGGAAPLGKPEMETVKMLVEQWNEQGGMDGKKIKLIAYDDKSDQNEAVLSTKKLIEQDKVTAIIGGTISGNSLAMIPQIEKAGIPYISLAASKQIVNPSDGSSRHWTFKTAQGDNIVIQKLLGFLKEKGWTNVAWLNVANAYGTSGHEEFKHYAPEYGVKAVIEEEFEATVDDAKAMLTRVKKANPQAIIVWGTAQESAVVTKNIRQLGIESPIVESHGIGTKSFIDLAGEAANGVWFPAGRILVADQLPDSDPQKETLLKYKEQFEKAYGYAPTTFGGHAWDAFHLLVNAIKEGGTDKEKIRSALENTKKFIGISGVFHMSKDDHTGLDADSLVMVQIQDGKFVLAEQ
ncbi:MULTISPECIES: ABC transporter substrate-binding protein [Geobacillus]|uniref:ABC transporter substrate-binding protein n=1 Tax=Geobacillus thermocatenulatus TaxID=33938 RepID=A0A226Q9I5_9BACL|nr:MULTISPECIES: ABC transporter substrate-binding protein [Geobacillus]ASS98286.1 ABC transporter substrate-binding protein [Geobacillus thermocatenulatus]KLR74327.1 ABC transporter substrate-binding protein [Geobacillus sp. T6]OXB89045.1 ABC transporter substrate-binding protein [Geobacillus thermocatenulatus]RAN22373.1 ABC transporter substrate-binding protein [Geobacillus sp. A8]